MTRAMLRAFSDDLVMVCRRAGAEWGEANGGPGVWGGKAPGAPHPLPRLPITHTYGKHPLLRQASLPLFTPSLT